MYLTTPSMVFFDFGGTLVDDKPFDPDRAGRALYACASNPEACSEDHVAALWTEVFKTACRQSHLDGVPMEIPPMSSMIRCTLDRAGLKTTLSMLELETAVQWQGNPYPMMPDADKILDCLHDRGIRTAVISNFSISSETLRTRIDQMLPRHRFEFVITSADYAYCKPSPWFFQSALGKAGVDSRTCWYCGDSLTADVAGALSCGMFPVLLDRKADPPISQGEYEGGKFLRINAWGELIAVIEKMQSRV